MKKALFNLLIASLLFGCFSCKPQPEPEPEKELNFMQASDEYMKPYLLVDYHKGDTLLFMNEKDEIDTFVVEFCDVMWSIIPHDDGKEEDGEFLYYDTLSVDAIFLIKGKQYSMQTAYFYAIEEESEEVVIYEDSWDNIRNYVFSDADYKSYGIEHTVINELNQTCTLRKNEGVIAFSDEKGHSWTKI